VVFLIKKIPKSQNDLITEYYLPFLSQRRVQEKFDIEHYDGESALVSLFASNELMREAHYPFSDIIDYIKEKTGKELEWKGEDLLTKSQVVAIFKKENVSFEEAISSKKLKAKTVCGCPTTVRHTCCGCLAPLFSGTPTPFGLNNFLKYLFSLARELRRHLTTIFRCHICNSLWPTTNPSPVSCPRMSKD
jgi:hypothetical protein